MDVPSFEPTWVILTGCVAALDAAFLWWAWRWDQAAGAPRARRAGYRPITTHVPL